MVLIDELVHNTSSL